MIILLDTSDALCKLIIIDGDRRVEKQWQADRGLAQGLLKWLKEQLSSEGKMLTEVTGIGAFAGPGSFTGLRIGLTVVNTLGDGLGIPVVGERGDQWQHVAITRLKNGENDKIVIPYYGSDATITMPRK